MIITAVVVALVVGVVLGAALVHASRNSANNTILHSLSLVFGTSLSNSTKQVETLGRVIETQDKLNKSLHKEKKMLQEQLNQATEHIAELESMFDDEEQGDTDDDDEHESEAHSRVKTSNRTDKEVHQESRAESKLITIRKLLEDAASKDESINPHSLLGIVNFKKAS